MVDVDGVEGDLLSYELHREAVERGDRSGGSYERDSRMALFLAQTPMLRHQIKREPSGELPYSVD